MARRSTATKVHRAVVEMVGSAPVAAITMEGIAERAGVSKQTLYRSWASTGAILCDALLARSVDARGAVVVPDSGDLHVDLRFLALAMVEELSDREQGPLLRAVTAEVLSDDALGSQVREHLLHPQLRGIAERFRAANVADPDAAAELFVGPIFHRWLLRTQPFAEGWAEGHAARVVRAVQATDDAGA